MPLSFSSIPQPPAISIAPGSLEAMGMALAQYSTTLSTSAVAVASAVYGYPFYLTQPYRVRSLWWVNGSTTAGTADCGIYSQSGTLLVSTGATLISGVSSCQVVNVDYTLPIGGYYAALSTNSATTTFCCLQGIVAQRQDLAGMVEYTPGTSTVPLPASVTFGPFAKSTLPQFGLSRLSTL